MLSTRSEVERPETRFMGERDEGASFDGQEIMSGLEELE